MNLRGDVKKNYEKKKGELKKLREEYELISNNYFPKVLESILFPPLLERIEALNDSMFEQKQKCVDLENNFNIQRCLSCCSLEDFENLNKHEFKKGCEGAVFKVKCTLDNELVKDKTFALKGVFNYDSVTNSEVRTSFIKEYKLLCNMPQHQNVINVWSSFVDKSTSPNFNIPSELVKDKALFIIMDFYEFNLEQYIKKVQINEEILKKMILDLLKGLNHINSHYVVHRDLKLNNILVNHEDKRLIIADFGMAKNFHDKSFKMSFDYNVQGNVDHQAPEILNNMKENKVIDYQLADIWALGYIIYEICGIDPFSKINNKRLYYDSANDLPEIKQSKIITQLAQRMLEFDISKRINYQDAILMLQNDQKK